MAGPFPLGKRLHAGPPNLASIYYQMICLPPSPFGGDLAGKIAWAMELVMFGCMWRLTSPGGIPEWTPKPDPASSVIPSG